MQVTQNETLLLQMQLVVFEQRRTADSPRANRVIDFDDSQPRVMQRKRKVKSELAL